MRCYSTHTEKHSRYFFSVSVFGVDYSVAGSNAWTYGQRVGYTLLDDGIALSQCLATVTGSPSRARSLAGLKRGAWSLGWAVAPPADRLARCSGDARFEGTAASSAVDTIAPDSDASAAFCVFNFDREQTFRIIVFEIELRPSEDKWHKRQQYGCWIDNAQRIIPIYYE